MSSNPKLDLRPYLEHARRERDRRIRENAGRLDRAWAVAREMAEFLRAKYHPTRIRLIGSMLVPGMFGEWSDIDLVIEGVSFLDYLRAWNDLEEHFTEFKVDVIDIETVSDLMRQRIDESGVDL